MNKKGKWYIIIKENIRSFYCKVLEEVVDIKELMKKSNQHSTMEKIKILSDSAKYDVSCSSSGSQRKSKKNGLGMANLPGICHSWTADGRCVSLLKILFSNDCVYDCKYCVSRKSNDIERAEFETEEFIQLTMDFYRRNYIEGLFLSSAVSHSPDSTMERMIYIVKILRTRENYNGYIHMKGIPGADERLIKEAGRYVDRMSVNLELPSEKSLKLLAPQKNKSSILTPMKFMKDSIEENKSLGSRFRGEKAFMPAGQTTQMMIGASPDTDYSILKLSEGMYKKFQMKRVYYSAYVPVMKDEFLPSISTPPLLREHRLYQADWLLRFYNFKADEILSKEDQSFDLKFDPKFNWAINNFKYFPVEINKVSYNTLLRIPGVGVTSARRIINARKYCALDYDSLKKMGVVMKRAKFFITCKGKYCGNTVAEPDNIKKLVLLTASDLKSFKVNNQISIEELYPSIYSRQKAVSGQI